MKNALLPHNLEALARVFVTDFCAKNQINFTPAKGADALSVKFAEWKTGMIAPTGNLSGMVREVNISFRVFNTEEDSPEIFNVIVQWDYIFNGGVSNTRMVMYQIFAPKEGQQHIPGYKGFCELKLVDRFISAFNHATEKKKGKNI